MTDESTCVLDAWCHSVGKHAGPEMEVSVIHDQGRLMKTLFCLLIATGVGGALQYAGIPHGLLLGSILATALIASCLHFSLPCVSASATCRSYWGSRPA